MEKSYKISLDYSNPREYLELFEKFEIARALQEAREILKMSKTPSKYQCKQSAKFFLGFRFQ